MAAIDGSISTRDLLAIRASGNLDLIEAEIWQALATAARLQGEAAVIVTLARLDLLPPDAEAQLADIARERRAASARLDAAAAALRQPMGSQPS
jgi:hypothetical protein